MVRSRTLAAAGEVCVREARTQTVTGNKKKGPTSSVFVLQAIVDVLESMGGAKTVMLDDLGVSPELLDDSAGRLPFTTILRAWELAPILTGNNAFGLHFGERVSMGAFSVLDYLARSCDTLGEALARLALNLRLLHDAVSVSIEQCGDTTVLEHRIDAAPQPGIRHAREAALSSYLTRARVITRTELTPVEVWFCHQALRNTSEHERIFRAPVLFGREVNRLVFHHRQLSLALPHAEPNLRQVLDEHARMLIAQIPRTNRATSRTARAIARSLPDGGPSLDAVAGRLHIAPRTLQRRLDDEGTSFSQLVELVRQRLAIQYLETTDLNNSEISHLLGFSEPSAFSRAFRRWTGVAPAQFRLAAKQIPNHR